jgi:hypothetical protein
VKRAPVSADFADQFEVEDKVRGALRVRPGESILDAARRVLAAKPGPARTVKRTQVAMIVVNGAGSADPWAILRQAARAVTS